MTILDGSIRLTAQLTLPVHQTVPCPLVIIIHGFPG